MRGVNRKVVSQHPIRPRRHISTNTARVVNTRVTLRSANLQRVRACIRTYLPTYTCPCIILWPRTENPIPTHLFSPAPAWVKRANACENADITRYSTIVTTTLANCKAQCSADDKCSVGGSSSARKQCMNTLSVHACVNLIVLSSVDELFATHARASSPPLASYTYFPARPSHRQSIISLSRSFARFTCMHARTPNSIKTAEQAIISVRVMTKKNHNPKPERTRSEHFAYSQPLTLCRDETGIWQQINQLSSSNPNRSTNGAQCLSPHPPTR